MDTRKLTAVVFVGCFRLSLKNAVKYFAIILALMDNINHGTGKLIKTVITLLCDVHSEYRLEVIIIN